MTARHVCQLGPVPPPWGGVQTHMVNVAERIRSIGWRASMISLTRHRHDNVPDVYSPRSAVEVLTTLRALRPDIVHVHVGGTFFAKQALLLLATGRLLPARSVFTFHSGGFPTSPEGLRAKPLSLRGLALQSQDAVIGVNAALASVFEKYGVDRSRIHMIEPHSTTLDVEAVRNEPLPTPVATFAAQHEPLLLTVGLLEEEYDIPLQVRAMEEIRRLLPNAGLVIIGSGSLEASIREEIATSATREHILLCGDVPRAKTLATIARANVLLRTTRFDGDALSVREALQLGTPVLATDNGMRPDGVQFVHHLDPVNLSRTIFETVTKRVQAVRTEHRGDPIDSLMELYRELLQRR